MNDSGAPSAERGMCKETSVILRSAVSEEAAEAIESGLITVFSQLNDTTVILTKSGRTETSQFGSRKVVSDSM